jgi:hypothetical protein
MEAKPSIQPTEVDQTEAASVERAGMGYPMNCTILQDILNVKRPSQASFFIP